MSLKSWLATKIAAKWIAKEGPKMLQKLLGTHWKTNLGGVAASLKCLQDIVACFSCTDCGDIYKCILSAVVAGGIAFGFFGAKDHNVTGGTVKQ